MLCYKALPNLRQLKNRNLEIYSQDSDPRIHYDFLYAESVQGIAVLNSI